MAGSLPDRSLILRYAALPHATGQRATRYEILASLYGDREVHQMIEQLAAAGMVEHGTSTRGCWLTEKGRFVLGDRVVEATVA